MKLTVDYLIEKFNKYNIEYFDGVLPSIKIVINRTKNIFGQYRYYRSSNEQPEKPICIAISKYYDRSELEIDTTLIHEMIHYYISFMGMKDTDSHGIIFSGMCKEIYIKSNHKFLITKSSSARNLKLTNSNKRYKIMMFDYNGRTCYARISEKFDYGYFAKTYKFENVYIFYSANSELDNWVRSTNRLKFYYAKDIKFNIKKAS